MTGRPWRERSEEFPDYRDIEFIAPTEAPRTGNQVFDDFMNRAWRRLISRLQRWRAIERSSTPSGGQRLATRRSRT
jgi:hypothetical protein